MKVQKQIDVKAYKPAGFIGEYRKLVKDTVIPYQYSILRDELPDTEKSHVYANFVNAGRALAGEDVADGFYGMVFQDSDAAKWIEAAAFSLAVERAPELEKKVDDFIDVIARAQDTDGYLDTFFTIKDRDKRWTNLLEAHELYCAGHLFEAGCAYFETTGKRNLLDVCEKLANHIYDHFITEGAAGYPGHPEVELALMKMYRTTGNKKYLDLADRFINTRGVDADFYKKEKERRSWQVWGNNAEDGVYQQSEKPVREQADAVGHAVRAVYLYTGMADLASEESDASLYEACKTLWESITKKRMYITGGIGSTVHGEAFSVDYDLPSDSAYAETCASCGLMFFASRMLENEVKSAYADVMENAFYNTVLAGMQLDGKRFFYVNPLEVNPGISGVAAAYRHDLPERPKWYGCACCPPNVARVVESFGKYAYGENDDTLFCHMYAAGEVKSGAGISLVCETGYPYELSVKYRVTGKGKLAVRIPGWSRKNSIRRNGKTVQPKITDGYAYFDIDGADELEFGFDEEPYYVFAAPKIPRLTAQACLKRGPLVYCFEGVDNGGCVTDLVLRKNGKTERVAAELCTENSRETIIVNVEAGRLVQGSEPYSVMFPEIKDITARAIPYYCWGNRGLNQMRVWLPVMMM